MAGGLGSSARSGARRDETRPHGSGVCLLPTSLHHALALGTTRPALSCFFTPLHFLPPVSTGGRQACPLPPPPSCRLLPAVPEAAEAAPSPTSEEPRGPGCRRSSPLVHAPSSVTTRLCPQRVGSGGQSCLFTGTAADDGAARGPRPITPRTVCPRRASSRTLGRLWDFLTCPETELGPHGGGAPRGLRKGSSP